MKSISTKNSRHPAHPRLVRRSGQTMIETGLVIVALLVMSLGMVQYGLAYNATLTLNNMAREGARWAAVRTDQTFKATPTNESGTLRGAVVEYLQARAAGTTIAKDKITEQTVALAFELPTPDQPNRRAARVTISYNMKENKEFLPLIVPLPESWSDYKATAANVMETVPRATATPTP